jgi:hypothetical protein
MTDGHSLMMAAVWRYGNGMNDPYETVALLVHWDAHTDDNAGLC